MILIEKTLKDYLGKVSSHVFMGYPQKPPDEFIIVEKVVPYIDPAVVEDDFQMFLMNRRKLT